MQIISDYQKGLAIIVMLVLAISHTCFSGETNAPKTTINNMPTNSTEEATQKLIREHTKDANVGYFGKAKAIVADEELKKKAAQINRIMKNDGTSQDIGPATLEDAGEFLRTHVAMACMPTKCFEYEGVFTFPGAPRRNGLRTSVLVLPFAKANQPFTYG